jgi:CPA1 family monovalent cation:H+ antiporter
VPYPILLVLGGLLLGLVPGVPNLELPPELVLLAFLPPLLFSAALFSSPHELRRNIRPITLLAFGLILATAGTVAVIAHLVVDLSWAASFLLGAIVSPTDPLAATAIARRAGVPRRVVTIVEGESLVNDATALVAYKFAVAAVLTGSFSLWEAGLRFVVGVVAGAVIGLAVGYLVAALMQRVESPPTAITISLLAGYFAYLPAEALDVSGVIAAVTAGLYLGWNAPRLLSVETRLPSAAVWEIFIFVANSLLFVLVGLQLPLVVDALGGRYSWGRLIVYAIAVCLTVILTRLAWVFPFTYLPRMLVRRIRERDPAPPRQLVTLVGWMGLRGAVSLAAALAVPHQTNTGASFPGRELIVFLAFAVILVTLVLQGLSLPVLIRALGVRPDRLGETEEARARVHAAEAALARIEELLMEDWVAEPEARQLRGIYDHRRRRFAARGGGGRGDPELEARSEGLQRLTREVLEAERAAVLALRDAGHIDDEVMRRIERDLDLEHARLGA